ncbi:MAG: hypothetical protein IJ523_01965 [Succinivibrionaceae bacterium]|nr:hypothetical protein [Succinivibrionaceae bacterium]
MLRFAEFSLLAALSLCFGGCANVNYPVQTKPENVVSVPRGDVHRYDDLDYKGLELNVIVSRMADQLERYKVDRGNDLPKLAIITFVDVRSYKTPNDLGRVLAENFIHEMHRRGENVYEHHLTGYVEVTPDGDLTLSRNARELARKMSVSRFLIGTLSRNKEGYVVNARIVSLKSNMVESTAVGIVPYAYLPSPTFSSGKYGAAAGGTGARGAATSASPAYRGRNNTRVSGGLIYREDPSASFNRQSVMR